jgi:hypothetical protein
MHVIVNFIGIVVLSCMGSYADPCAGAFPLHLRAYLPNAMSNPTMCNQALPKHTGFIRIKVNPITESWAGSIKCEPSTASNPCTLYPLSAGAITISGVTGSGGGITSPWVAPALLRWKEYEPQLTINPATAEASSVGFLDIADGKMTGNYVKGGMFVSKLSVAAGSGNITVAQGAKTLVLADKSEIDVINLPKATAEDFPVEPVVGHPHGDNPRHFYIHYMVAATPPAVACCGPDDNFHCPPKTEFVDLGRAATATELREDFAMKQKAVNLALAQRADDLAKLTSGKPTRTKRPPLVSTKVKGGAQVSCSNSVYP